MVKDPSKTDAKDRSRKDTMKNVILDIATENLVAEEDQKFVR